MLVIPRISGTGIRIPRWCLWIAAVALTALTVLRTTSFAVRVRVTSDTACTATWVAYRPWRPSARAPGDCPASERRPEALEGWCSRTTTRGSVPWFTWDAVVVTCVSTSCRHRSAAEGVDANTLITEESSR